MIYMANDPRRDVLPVKDDDSEKYCALTFRSTNNREFSPSTPGNYTAKLDRNELENRYLRFVEENINLKKHCHNQEEKIKRLAAKLLRLVAEQRNSRNKGSSTPKYSDLEVEELISRVNELERSNQLLREKLMVAGIQLSTHHPPRIPHKSPQRFGTHSSSKTDFTRASEHAAGISTETPDPLSQNQNVEQSSIPKNPCQFLEQEVSKLRNQLLNYEKELETVTEQSNARVQALEDELTHVQEEGSRMAAALSAASAAAHTSARNLAQTSRRVAENVEMIRLHRNIKAQEEQLHCLEAERRKALDDAQMISVNLQALQKENFELNECLLNERKNNSELQNEIHKLSTNQLALQDLQEEINDLRKEKSILQDTNNKLMQSIIEEGLENESHNSQIMETVKECSNHQNCNHDAIDNLNEQLQGKELDVQQRSKNSKKMEEDNIRKEKKIDKRVKELEEELKRKVELEKEAQIKKEKEEQRERERELKEREIEKQRALEASEHEKLKQQAVKVESLLKTSLLERDKLADELKARKSRIKELESNNSKLTEKLSAKNLEISELLKAQKKFMGNPKIDSETQYEEREEETEDHFVPDSKKAECNDIISDNSQKESPQLTDLINKNGIECEQKLPENGNIINEEETNTLEWQKKFYEVSNDLEKAEKRIEELTEINFQCKKKVSNLENELEFAHLKYNELITEVNQKETKNDDDPKVKKDQVPLLPGHNRPLNEDQCAFDLYMDHILVSEEGKAILRKIVGETSSPGIFLTWIFYEQEAAYTPIFEGPDAHVDCSYSVVVPIKHDFFEYLNKEYLLIELHVAIEDISIPVAYGKIPMYECLNYPKSKLYHSIPLISYPNKSNDEGPEKMEKRRESPSCEFGILQYHFGLNCAKIAIFEYKEALPKKSQQFSEGSNKNVSSSDNEETINKKDDKGEETGFNSFSGKENDYEENSLTLERLKSPPKPAPRISKTQIKKSVDLNDVEPAPQIVIVVHSFRLLPESSAAKNPNIHQLFVEYTFLGKQGESMETPVSLPKPHSNEKLCFNFRKVFPMDPVENAMERNILQNMIHMKGSKRQKSSLLAEGKIHFNVVSEPLEDEDPEAECIDIGYAEISVPQILVNGEDIVEEDINVINSDGSKEVIGYLNISFLANDLLQTLCGHC